MIKNRLEVAVNTLDDRQWQKACKLSTEDIIRNNIEMGKKTTRRYVQDVLEVCVRLVRTNLM